MPTRGSTQRTRQHTSATHTSISSPTVTAGIPDWRVVGLSGEVLFEEAHHALPGILCLRCGVGHPDGAFDDADRAGKSPVVHEAVADVRVFLDVTGHRATRQRRFELGSGAAGDDVILGPEARNDRTGLA